MGSESMPPHVAKLLSMNDRIRRDVPGVVETAITLARIRQAFPEFVEEVASNNTLLWLNCGPYQKSASPSATRSNSHTDWCCSNFYLVVRHTGIHLAKPTAVIGLTLSPINGRCDLTVGPDEYATLVAIHNAFKNVEL